MMVQALRHPTHSPEEYLERELISEERHEYIDGEIIPMTGGTPNPNQIALNLSGALNFHLRQQPFQVFVADQRLAIPQSNLYTYPDVMVVAGELAFVPGRKDTIQNPIVIAEVLSSSTQEYDRTGKFRAYRTLTTFQEYLLIDQYSLHVEHYFKTGTRQWIFSEYDEIEMTLSLSSFEFEIELADLYNKVQFGA